MDKEERITKLLVLSYYWPPSGGAGVQRWLKLSKYLQALGVQVKIITVHPDCALYPQVDNGLSKESETLDVIKTKAFKFQMPGVKKVPFGGSLSPENPSLKFRIMKWVRGNVIFPDPRVGWNKYAFKEAQRLIKEEGFKHVVTTSPPHSTQLIGLKLKEVFKDRIKWIADLRDPWTDIYYFSQLGIGPRMLKRHRAAEKSVIEKSDLFLTVGQNLKEMYLAKANCSAEKGKVIYNGFDEKDFVDQTAKTNHTVADISYLGTIAESYNLTGFVEVLKNSATPLHLRFIGHVHPSWVEAIEKAKGRVHKVEWVNEVPHSDVSGYLNASKLLLLIIPEVVNNECIITGKIFEYLRSGKKVLGIGPVKGDASLILNETKAGKTFNYTDWKGMRSYIFDRLNSFPESFDEMAVQKFSREEQAKVLRQIIFT